MKEERGQGRKKERREERGKDERKEGQKKEGERTTTDQTDEQFFKLQENIEVRTMYVYCIKVTSRITTLGTYFSIVMMSD